MLVLPSLVRMKDQPGAIRDLLKSLVQHGGYHAEYRTIRYGITDQIAAVQIENRGQIQFLPKQAELCYLRDPLLIRLFRVKIPIQQIRCDFTCFSLL